MAKKGGTHHGGAWKVAYADFVTAMMALFMVLWISAQDKEILISTSQYFQNPFKSPMNANAGVLPFNNRKNSGTKGDEQSEKAKQDKTKQVELAFLNSVAADFYRLLHLDENLEAKPIDVQVTTDGLRVTLFDRATRPLFVGETAEFTEWGSFVLQTMAWTIDRHQFRITIDGHTKAASASETPDYTGWELSADRANAARRLLVRYAVEPGLIERVTGYAASRPIAGEPIVSDANQRITLSLTLTAKSRTALGAPAAKPRPISATGSKPSSPPTS